MAVVRGDHEVNEIEARARARRRPKCSWRPRPTSRRRPAPRSASRVPSGFTGKIVIDRDAASVRDAVTGANETDYHLKHVLFGRDFQAEVASHPQRVERATPARRAARRSASTAASRRATSSCSARTTRRR